MNLSKAIEGGLAGASTLSLLQETLHKIDSRSPRPLLHQSGVIRKLQKKKHKGKKANRLYIQLAGELVANAAFFGLAGLGKRRNAILRGGLLGAAAGLGTVFLQDDQKAPDYISNADRQQEEKENLKKKLLTVALYTAGGLLAGAAIKNTGKKTKKSRKNK